MVSTCGAGTTRGTGGMTVTPQRAKPSSAMTRGAG